MSEENRPPPNIEGLREPGIKAALIDALYAEGGIYGDTVIVSEMPVASMGRRADLVVANGHLLGFEIKSDGDKTSRLLGQLKAYTQTFEGVVIVTGAKHLAEALQTAPPMVGVVAVDHMTGDLPTARIVRKPYVRSMTLEAAVRQMRADELYRLSRQAGMNPDALRDRHTLETIVRQMPAPLVRSAALSAIKARYRAPFEAFADARTNGRSTVSALQHLKRPVSLVRAKVTARACSEVATDGDLTTLASLSLNVRPRYRG
jgi:hypothetical protein